MKVLVAGDFVSRRRIALQIESGDYSCLKETLPLIQEVDYAIVNFESPVVERDAKPIDKTGPNLRCHKRTMECVMQAGFHCVTLANNHFRDYGQIGVEDTIAACKAYGIDYVGGGIGVEESHEILYKDILGKTLAIINVCENEWSIAVESYGGSNPLDIVDVSRAISEAKSKANYVLLIIHGGTEMYNLPTPRMKKTYRFFVEQGADAVVNHHQHCYSGYEVYQDKPIFYGLGNFCFDKPKSGQNKPWEEGYCVSLNFDDVISFQLHPYVQCSEERPSVCLSQNEKEFLQAINDLNAIIADDGKLEKEFAKMAKSHLAQVEGLLRPYDNRILNALNARGFFPSLIKKNRIKLLLALSRCEAHRDVIVESLKQKLS